MATSFGDIYTFFAATAIYHPYLPPGNVSLLATTTNVVLRDQKGFFLPERELENGISDLEMVRRGG